MKYLVIIIKDPAVLKDFAKQVCNFYAIDQDPEDIIEHGTLGPLSITPTRKTFSHWNAWEPRSEFQCHTLFVHTATSNKDFKGIFEMMEKEIGLKKNIAAIPLVFCQR